MPYHLIDHTADIGIQVIEPTIKGLFETAALAMFDQITHKSELKGTHTKDIHVKGIDQPDLLINWLRELLWFWTIDNYLVKQVTINNLNSDGLSAKIFYEEFDPQSHEILNDIKAVTYHGASVKQTDNGWQATIIFDV